MDRLSLNLKQELTLDNCWIYLYKNYGDLLGTFADCIVTFKGVFEKDKILTIDKVIFKQSCDPRNNLLDLYEDIQTSNEPLTMSIIRYNTSDSINLREVALLSIDPCETDMIEVSFYVKQYE